MNEHYSEIFRSYQTATKMSSNGSNQNGAANGGIMHAEVTHDTSNGVAALKRLKRENQTQQQGHLLDGRTFKGVWLNISNFTHHFARNFSFSFIF